MKAVNRKQVNRGLRARSESIPAPVGGWNARDPLAMMKPEDAIDLWNWIPRAAELEGRKGAETWVTGFSAVVKSLMPYSSASGTEKLFAATNSGIYDVTSAGTMGATVAAATEGYCQHVNLNIAGNSYLYLVNGVDTPKLYNGTTWTSITGVSTPAITGVTTTNLVNISLHKRRVFFVQKNSMSFWYLPVMSLGGAASEFPLDSLFKLGGYLMALDTWSLDAGEGMDDHLVAITSEGEVAVYKGTDPSSVTAWSLVGVFYIGKPLGRKCFVRFGGDLLVITQNGIVPLSRGLLSSSINQKQALSRRIEEVFREAALEQGDYLGWQGLVVPSESLLLFNIPSADFSGDAQYVMNTLTGAWCKFTGWTVGCMALLGDQLYLGTTISGAYSVSKGLIGYSDFDAAITLYAKSAFSYFGSRGMVKDWTLFRPIYQATDSVSVGFRMDVDFDSPYYSNSISRVTSAGNSSLWDTGRWDSAVWGGALQNNKNWYSIASKEGYCAALAILVDTRNIQITWSSTDFKFLVGKGL